MGWFQHAFAVDPPGEVEPTEAQQIPVDWFCRQVAKRRLTTPGLIALEMARPLNYVGAAALHMMGPAVWAIARQQTHENYAQFTEYLEKRGSIDYICRRIEHFEADFEQRKRAAKKKAETDQVETETDERNG